MLFFNEIISSLRMRDIQVGECKICEVASVIPWFNKHLLKQRLINFQLISLVQDNDLRVS